MHSADNKLSIEQNNEIKNIFHIFDTDSDGFIQFSEFFNVLKKFGISRCEFEIREMFDEIDSNKNNLIEYSELIDFYLRYNTNDDINNIIDAFYILDKEQKKYISLNDFSFFVKKTGINLQFSKLIDEFQYEDIDSDNKISMNEFINIVYRKDNINNIKLIIDTLVIVNKLETKNLIDPKCKLITYEKYEFLKNIHIFNKVYRSRLLRICNKLEIVTYPYREIICKESDKFSYFYLVFNGFVDIKTKVDCVYKSIALKGPGFIIGIYEFFNKLKNYKYYINAHCKNLKIYKITINSILQLIDIDKVFLFRFKELYNTHYHNLFIDKKTTFINNSKLVPINIKHDEKIYRIKKSLSSYGTKLDLIFPY